MLSLTTVTTCVDYKALVALNDTRFPDYHRSVREMMEFDRSLSSAGRRNGRFLAYEDNRVVAHAFWTESVNYFAPGRFMLNIVVHPESGRRGIGTRIFETLVEATGKIGLAELAAHMCDHDPAGPAFALKMGFYEASRAYEMRVDPGTVDPADYAGLIRRLKNEGVTFTTLPELKSRDSNWLPKIYDLYTKLDGSTPSPVEYVAPSVETLLRTEIEPEDGVPEAFFVALKGHQWIGLSEVRMSEEGPHPLRQGLTGVLPEYRGRGLAKALKIHVFEWVRRNGFASLRTWNDATNAPMVHVNESMGFRRHASWILFRKIMESRT